MKNEKLKEAINEWITFCNRLTYELKDFKGDEYKNGVAEGIDMAVSMFEDYLEDFPELNAPKND